MCPYYSRSSGAAFQDTEPDRLGRCLVLQGQKRVPAAQAQIIFSSLPLWSALFAALLLQGERLGAFGWAGGLLIICAGVIASRR